MYSDWFSGIEILQGRWQHGEKVGYCYLSGLEKTFSKWDIHVPLVIEKLSWSSRTVLSLSLVVGKSGDNTGASGRAGYV
jgi:hypothetical protein